MPLSFVNAFWNCPRNSRKKCNEEREWLQREKGKAFSYTTSWKTKNDEQEVRNGVKNTLVYGEKAGKGLTGERYEEEEEEEEEEVVSERKKTL